MWTWTGVRKPWAWRAGWFATRSAVRMWPRYCKPSRCAKTERFCTSAPSHAATSTCVPPRRTEQRTGRRSQPPAKSVSTQRIWLLLFGQVNDVREKHSVAFE